MNDVFPNADARGRRWLPSLSAMIWVVLFLGLNLTNARQVLISADSDPALHRRLGEWMIQHGSVVREYRLLHTYSGPVVTKEWLSELLFAGAARFFGWNGFVLLTAALIATCFWLLHRQLLRESCDVELATGLVLMAMYACLMHWIARPHLFTHLLIIVFAWNLRWFQHGRISTRQVLTLLPPLMVLWVNLHGAFMTGLVLIAMHTLGSAVDARRQSAQQTKAKFLAALLLFCTVATLANPNGWKLPMRIVSFLQSRELSALTSEFASPNFHTVGMRGFLLLLLVLAITLLTIRPKIDATDGLLVGGWGGLALFSARNVPVFALIVTPLLAQWLTQFVQANHRTRWSQLYSRWTTRVPVINRAADIATIIAVIVCVLLVTSKPGIIGGTSVLTTDFPSNRYPIAAVNWLRAHPEAVHGEMFNHFFWGGYLDFALPERKPFIDSHGDAYGIELVRDFRTANEPKSGWEDVFSKYHVGWTILPHGHALNSLLALRTDWRLVYADEVAVVYGRITGPP